MSRVSEMGGIEKQIEAARIKLENTYGAEAVDRVIEENYALLERIYAPLSEAEKDAVFPAMERYRNTQRAKRQAVLKESLARIWGGGITSYLDVRPALHQVAGALGDLIGVKGSTVRVLLIGAVVSIAGLFVYGLFRKIST